MQEVDADKDGVIDFEEFVEAMTKVIDDNFKELT